MLKITENGVLKWNKDIPVDDVSIIDLRAIEDGFLLSGKINLDTYPYIAGFYAKTNWCGDTIWTNNWVSDTSTVEFSSIDITERDKLVLCGTNNYSGEFDVFVAITDAPPDIQFECGDVTSTENPGQPDGNVNLLDITYLIDYKYKNGPPPYLMQAGDVNSDCILNMLDILYFIDYLFKSGAPLMCP